MKLLETEHGIAQMAIRWLKTHAMENKGACQRTRIKFSYSQWKRKIMALDIENPWIKQVILAIKEGIR